MALLALLLLLLGTGLAAETNTPSDTPTGQPTSYPTYTFFGLTDDDLLPPDKGLSCGAMQIRTQYECELYHRDRLLAYRNQSSIVPHTGAIPNKNSTSAKKVRVAMKLNDLNGVDSILGAVNMGVELSCYWRNDFLSWDVERDCSKITNTSTKTCPDFDVYELTFDRSSMWTPDFQLANDVVPFDQGFPKDQKVVVDFAGGSSMVLTGQITFSCSFAMTDFPFDTQTCAAVFASRTYYSYLLSFDADKSAAEYKVGVDASPRPVEVAEAFVWMDSFTHPAWRVQGVAFSTGSRPSIRSSRLGSSDFSTATWTVKLRRYSSYYAYSAIGPTVLVSIVAYFALYISDVDSRMGTVMTCLLTIMAVQWTVSSYIPVTNDNPWILRLCSACEFYVGCLCVVVFFVSYLDEIKYASERVRGQAVYPVEEEEGPGPEGRRDKWKGGGLLGWFAPPHPSIESDQPMPAWLKLVINLCRPVRYAMHLAGRRVHLPYDYQDAAFSINVIVRVLALAALVYVIAYFFSMVEWSRDY